MEIVKEHRWFAPLLSVLLVCILGIGLYAEVQQTQNNHKNAPMQSLSWSGTLRFLHMATGWGPITGQTGQAPSLSLLMGSQAGKKSCRLRYPLPR